MLDDEELSRLRDRLANYGPLMLAVAGVLLVAALAYSRQLSIATNEPHMGLFQPQDTYANWIVAIFAVVSAALSGIAILLLREQLILTRKAVDEAAAATDAANASIAVTREIGQKQVRAYVSPVDCRLIRTSYKEFSIRFDILNSGISPATIIDVEVELQVNLSLMVEHPQTGDIYASNDMATFSAPSSDEPYARAVIGALPAGGRELVEVRLESSSLIKAVGRGEVTGTTAFVEIRLSYFDVFKEREKPQSFYFMARVSGFAPQNEQMQCASSRQIAGWPRLPT